MPSNVVLTMHPNTREIWKEVVPGVPEEHHVEVNTSPQGWHKRSLDPVLWDGVHCALLGAVRETQADPSSRLHVLAAGPYSLGLLLGRKIEGHRPLSVYQYDGSQPDGRRWVCWGPSGLADIPSPGSFFQPLEGMPLSAREDVRDVTLTIEVSIEIFENVVAAQPGLGLQGALALRLKVPRPGQKAMQARDADVAEEEIGKALELIRLRLSNARVHLFYAGPLALLIRMGRRIHIGGTELIIYERTDDGAYHPAMRFPNGVPLWRPEARGVGVVLRHRPDEAGLNRAGNERFEIEVDGKKSEASFGPPSEERFFEDLSWLLNKRLDNGPGEQENAVLAGRIEASLTRWAAEAGATLADVLGSVTPGSLALEFRSPGSATFRWPWEWIKLPSGQAIGAMVPLWRSLPTRPPRPPGPLLAGPIRVLLCISRGAGKRASDDVSYRNVAAPLLELANLYPDRLEVEILRRPCTLSAIQARLRETSRPVHVLHIDGHGDQGTLCLEDDQLRPTSMTAGDLADAVADVGLRAVVLNACHSAEAQGCDPLNDVAVEIHRRGVPAVLAMQAALRVDAARILARAFYVGLSQTGRIDLATKQARDELFRDKLRDSKGHPFSHPDWGVPVLYLHPRGDVIASFDSAPMTNRTTALRSQIAMDWMVLQLDQIVLHAPGGAVLVHGTLGSGKSALLDDAIQWWLDVRWLATPPARLDGAVTADDPTPGASAVLRLREASEALGTRTDRQLRIVVWDQFDDTRPWTWSAADRKAFTTEISALASQGGTLLLAGRDRLRRLGGLTRLPMDGLCMREARQHSRALARSRPGAQRGDGDGTFDVLEQICEHSAHNPACLNAMFQAALQEGWTPKPLSDLRVEQLPDALHEPFDALSSSLEVVLAEIDEATLVSLPGRLERNGLELRVPPEEARMGGPLDLLERAGAIGLSPLRDRSGALRYRVHPLLMIWLERLAASRAKSGDR